MTKMTRSEHAIEIHVLALTMALHERGLVPIASVIEHVERLASASHVQRQEDRYSPEMEAILQSLATAQRTLGVFEDRL